jgi:hypothetical protein
MSLFPTPSNAKASDRRHTWRNKCVFSYTGGPFWRDPTAEKMADCTAALRDAMRYQVIRNKGSRHNILSCLAISNCSVSESSCHHGTPVAIWLGGPETGSSFRGIP